jgi:hypothetical protein
LATVFGVLVAVAAIILQQNVSTNFSFSPQGQVGSAQVSTAAGSTAILFGVIAILSFFGNLVLTGLLTLVIAQSTLGRKETAAGAWVATRSRLFPLIGTVLLASLIIGAGWVAAIALSVGVAVLIGTAAHLIVVGVLVGIVGGTAATVFAVIVGIRWSGSIPVVVLERTRAAASLGRSWRLVRGSGWRVFGILLLSELIVGAASLILRVPFLLVGTVAGGVGGTIISAIGTIIASTVTAPVLAGVVVLLYTDLRMRREGWDIALQAAAATSGPPSAAGPPSTPGPPPGTPSPPGPGPTPW